MRPSQNNAASSVNTNDDIRVRLADHAAAQHRAQHLRLHQHARNAMPERVPRGERYGRIHPLAQRRHHAQQHRLAAEGAPQLLRIPLCLPFQHLGKRDIFKLFSCTEINQSGARLRITQVRSHLLHKRRSMRIHRAAIGIEAAHHAVLIRADHHRAKCVAARGGNNRFVHRTEYAVDLHRLGQHQRGLHLGRLQPLQQALIVLRNQKLIGTFRQHDIQANHSWPGNSHCLQEFAEIRMPQSKRLFERLVRSLVDTDDDDIVLHRVRHVSMQEIELHVQHATAQRRAELR